MGGTVVFWLLLLQHSMIPAHHTGTLVHSILSWRWFIFLLTALEFRARANCKNDSHWMLLQGAAHDEERMAEELVDAQGAFHVITR